MFFKLFINSSFLAVYLKLIVQIPEKIIRGEEIEVQFSFANPLREDLSECTLSLDGSGLLRPRAITLDMLVRRPKILMGNFN